MYIRVRVRVGLGLGLGVGLGLDFVHGGVCVFTQCMILGKAHGKA